MTLSKTLKFGLLALPLLLLTSCKKTSCYSEELYQASKNSFCTADCPGVKGCDGKTYCNACEAARKGIKAL